MPVRAELPGPSEAPAVAWLGVSHVFPMSRRGRGRAARPALDGVDLRVAMGEWVFLVGPSGAGKTTLLRLAYGALRPTRGEVRVLGEPVGVRPIHLLRRRLGLVFQSFELLPAKTALENVAYGAEVLGRPPGEARRLAEAMLSTLGLEDLADRFPNELSAGEQQRVGIARALIHRPAVVLADEPTGNLDLASARVVFEVLSRIHRLWSPAVVVATHSRELLAWGGHRVVRVEGGRIASDEGARIR
ncbi:MAG: ABC transporter ATP-binding protein [Clostridia bacterium]|nr:ABC transporter ATP-binding protein [Clostridia bacterium]